MPDASPRERLLVAAGVLAFLFLVTFKGGVFVYQFHKASSGAWLDEGARVLDGEAMYRDFVDPHGPGIVHLNALAFALVGRHVNAAAGAALLGALLLAVALHALAARLAPWPWRLLPPLALAVVIVPPFDFGHPRWPALALGVLALERIGAHGPGPRGLLRAGLLLGASALFGPDVALPLAAGVVAAVATAGARAVRGRALGAFALGLLVLPGLGFTALALRAGPGAVLRGWLTEPLAAALGEAGGLALSPWGVRPAVFLALGLGGIAAAAGALRRRDEPRAALARVVAMAGLCLAAVALLGPLDPYALAVRTVPLLPLLAAALPGWSAGKGVLPRWTARALLLVLALGVAHGLGLVALRQWTLPLVRQRFRAGAVWIGAPNVELPWLESHAPPGARVFVFPAGGGSYFLTATRNATAFPYAVEGRFTPAEQEHALRALDAAAAEAGIWMGGQQAAAAGDPRALDRLESGIRARYRTAAALPGGSLALLRGPGPAPSGTHSDAGRSGAPLTGTNAPSVSESGRSSR